MPTGIKEKSGMLSLTSTVQEALRALYFFSSDYIMLQQRGAELLIHKEQLVGLLEEGRETVVVDELSRITLHAPLSAKMQLEDVLPKTILLVFDGAELRKTTFGDYRNDKIDQRIALLPEWWNIPLPLLNYDGQTVSLNEMGHKLVPGSPNVIAKQLAGLPEDKILTIKEKKKERTFALNPLDETTYLVEDISGDYEMAEDLVWWAAIGKAFVRRMEKNGLFVRRLSPHENPPDNVTETIPCLWEGQLLGRLAIEAPSEPLSEGGEGEIPATPLPPADAAEDGTQPETKEAQAQMPEETPADSDKPKVGRGRKAKKQPTADEPQKTLFTEEPTVAVDAEKPKRTKRASTAKKVKTPEAAVEEPAVAAMETIPDKTKKTSKKMKPAPEPQDVKEEPKADDPPKSARKVAARAVAQNAAAGKASKPEVPDKPVKPPVKKAAAKKTVPPKAEPKAVKEKTVTRAAKSAVAKKTA